MAAALLVAVSMLLLASAGSPDADAQIDCADGLAGFDVSTAAEFNAAIVCINENPPVGPDGFPTSSSIDLLNDIEANTLAGGAVFEPITSSADVDIEGNGFIIYRSPNTPNTQLPLLSFQGGGEVNIFELGLDLSLADISGIDFIGSKLGLWAVGIRAPIGSAATGVAIGEDADEVNLRGTSIEGVAFGVVSDSFISIVESTIQSTSTDLLSPNSDFAAIDTSTLAGPTGIQMSDTNIQVQNSTILGDGGRPGGPNGFVQYRSSIVGSCTAAVIDPFENPDPPDPPTPVVLDFGTNAGGCFDPSHVIDVELADNGCQVPTPFGCPRTVQISADSPALSVGDCTDIFTDQRDADRTPVGVGCDAGSFEYDQAFALCEEASGQFEIATADDLKHRH